jgi:hypothetical protein
MAKKIFGKARSERELKPCPNCGGKAVTTRWRKVIGQGATVLCFQISCRECPLQIKVVDDYNISEEQAKEQISKWPRGRKWKSLNISNFLQV